MTLKHIDKVKKNSYTYSIKNFFPYPISMQRYLMKKIS